MVEGDGTMSNVLHDIRHVAGGLYEVDVELDHLSRRAWYRIEHDDGVIKPSDELFFAAGHFLRPVLGAFDAHVRGKPCPLPQTLVPSGS